MKRILVLTALAATVAVGVVASPATAGVVPPLSDLTVNPNTGRPGDAFAVSGSGCERIVTGLSFGRSVAGRFAPRGVPGPSQNFSVSVAVAFPAPVATTTTPNSDGEWSVDFVVPQGTPPGVYEVAAVCLFQGGAKKMGVTGTPFPYESSTYTVIGDPAATPAPAVPGTPRFTG